MTGDSGLDGARRLAAAGARVGPGVRAWLGEKLTVGEDVVIGRGTTLVADELELGAGVRIGVRGDVRAATVRIGAASELQDDVHVVAADVFAIGDGSRIEHEVSVTCRAFTAGDLFYLGHHSSVGYGGTTASTAMFRAGERVAIGPHSVLNANRTITLADQVGSGSYLSVWTHGFHFGHRLLDGYEPVFADVHVERNVWLGYHVTLLPGVRIGANTILAAGAVVAKDLPADVLAAGVPAAVKRPLTARPLAGRDADARIAGLLDEWVAELDWKGLAVTRDRTGELLVGAGHRICLVPAGSASPELVPDGRRRLLLSVEDRADLRVGDVLFELRSGGLSGELDDVGHDLRDFLRRNALPCGATQSFRSISPEPFNRLRRPDRASSAAPAGRAAPSAGGNIYQEMTALADRHGAVNLGQGFPDTSGPDAVVEAAVAAMRAGHNQYPPVPGVPALREAIARHQRDWYGLTPDPDREVLVTAGASEAVTAALCALVGPGDEVIVPEPCYDLYPGAVALARATLVPARGADADAVAAAVTERTRVLLLNSPHNPTGAVLEGQRLAALAAVAVEHDLLVVTDEVYEHLLYDGRVHQPIAAQPGMADRTVSVSSAGKTFSLTGWKVGWVTGPAHLVRRVAAVKQYLSFASGTPLQHAVAVALALPREYYDELRTGYQRRRDQLVAGLADLGFGVTPPAGAYFVTADIRGVGAVDGMSFCRDLPGRVGVAAIPNEVFYSDPADGRHEVRFTFAKRPEVLDEALDRLRRGLRSGW